MEMASVDRFDRTIFLVVLAGVLLGAVVGFVLLLWVVPEALNARPAVLSTIVVPLGCFGGWVLSPSRERAPTAALACFGLYFLSAFGAARLGIFTNWNYFYTVVGVQVLGGTGLAMLLAFLGRALPQVEQLRETRNVTGLAKLARWGTLSERLEAVRALASLDDTEARPVLLAALDDADDRVSQEILSVLVGQATEADVPRLEAFLEHPDPRLRRQVIHVLHWIEGDAARKALIAYRRGRSGKRP